MIKINPIGTQDNKRFHKIAMKVRQNMISVFAQGATQTKAYLDMTVEHWYNPPTMHKTINTMSSEISAFVGPFGTGEQVSKWEILNKGNPRFAKMKRPPEFVRKTHPGTLRTNPGTMPSQKGVEYYTYPIAVGWIESRKWTKLTMLLMRRWIRVKARKAMRDSFL